MKIAFNGVVLGTDPEFFLKKGKSYIGAEKVIPKEGLFMKDYSGNNAEDRPRVIIDGIQGEFNPPPSECRQSLSYRLHESFLLLHNHIRDTKSEAKIAIPTTVSITKKEMESLLPENRMFGCDPSFNAYGEAQLSVTDASQYYFRSAGGHIHLGPTTTAGLKAVKKDPAHIIRIMDIIVGNTCVLLDRDEGNVIRRRTYGRAGEYRLPSHGIEYRVPSNFWLVSYTVFSFVFALARFAYIVAIDEAASKQLLSMVDLEAIRKAINTNDFDLAYKNFNAIKEFLGSITLPNYPVYALYFPLEGVRLQKFEKFVSLGIEHFFKEDVVEHWINQYRVGGGGVGWERFIDSLTN